jgi:hypothetical protein
MTQFEFTIMRTMLEIGPDAGDFIVNVHISGGQTITDIHDIEYFQNGMVRLENQKHVSAVPLENLVAITRIHSSPKKKRVVR